MPERDCHRSAEHRDSGHHRAMRHILRAQQLLQSENSSQNAFGKRRAKERQAPPRPTEQGGQVFRIQTVQDVHGLMSRKSTHLSIGEVRRELVRALLANLHDEPMKHAIVVVLQSLCRHVGEQKCMAGKVASCQWSQSWLSRIIGNSGKCQMNPTLDILSRDHPFCSCSEYASNTSVSAQVLDQSPQYFLEDP